LTVENKKDVIEYPIDEQLDISGWDLKKALHLFRKSNPPLFEWLLSPVVYSEPFCIPARMRELAKTYYSPSACIYHYLHMADGNYRQYLMGDYVWTKKYLYVLRPILAIKWIESGYGIAPTGFEMLLERVITSEQLKAAIQNLVDSKREGNELDHSPRNYMISNFIECEMERLKKRALRYENNPAPYSVLDQIFQDGLQEVWQKL
jgi:predicted nucleotidyltransferase